jgi:hypothetical protein
MEAGMASRIDFYLEDLQRRAERELEPEEARALCREVRLHLDAALQARLELGNDPAEAEWQTVESFGRARELVARLADVHERRDGPLGAHIPTVAWAAAALAWAGFWLIWAHPNLTMPALKIGLLLLIAGFAWQSFRARKWQIAPLIALGALSWPIMTVVYGTTWLHLGANGGFGYIMIWNADSSLAQARSTVETLRPQVDRHAAGYEAFRRGQPIPPEFVTAAGVLVPATYDRKALRLDYRPVRPGEDPWQTWRDSRGLESLDLRFAEATIASLPTARATPLWRRWLGASPSAATAAAGCTAVLLALNGVAAGLGVLARRRRRGPTPRMV